MIFICYLIIFYFNLPLSFILKNDLSTQVYYKTNASYGQAGGVPTSTWGIIHFSLKIERKRIGWSNPPPQGLTVLAY